MNPKTTARLRTIARTGGTIVLAGALLVAVVEANAWKRGLKVTKVRCEGNRIVPDADLLRLAAVPGGSKLYSVDLVAVQNRVLQNPYMRSAFVKRELPGEIVVVAEERMPIAAVPQDPPVYLDAEGTVLPAIASDVSYDLPLVTGVTGPVGPGKRLTDSSVLEALLILTMARKIGDELYRKISEVHAQQGKEIVVYTTEGGVPVVFGRGETAAKIAKLDAFWQTVVSQRDVRELEYVDLRYQHQVVARWAAKRN